MQRDDNEVLFFHQCRSLDGSAHRVEVGRRNRLPTAIIRPDWALIDPSPDPEEVDRRAETIREELSINLNPVERRTWRQLINERPICEIALGEGVTRTAIYERIRGNSKGQGGMIAKNPYVALWWIERLRRKRIV